MYIHTVLGEIKANNVNIFLIWKFNYFNLSKKPNKYLKNPKNVFNFRIKILNPLGVHLTKLIEVFYFINESIFNYNQNNSTIIKNMYIPLTGYQ